MAPHLVTEARALTLPLGGLRIRLLDHYSHLSGSDSTELHQNSGNAPRRTNRLDFSVSLGQVLKHMTILLLHFLTHICRQRWDWERERERLTETGVGGGGGGRVVDRAGIFLHPALAKEGQLRHKQKCDKWRDTGRHWAGEPETETDTERQIETNRETEEETWLLWLTGRNTPSYLLFKSIFFSLFQSVSVFRVFCSFCVCGFVICLFVTSASTDYNLCSKASTVFS